MWLKKDSDMSRCDSITTLILLTAGHGPKPEESDLWGLIPEMPHNTDALS